MLCGSIPVQWPLDIPSFAKMHDGIIQWLRASMTESMCLMAIPCRHLGNIELTPIDRVRFAVFADFHIHIAMDLGERLSRQPGTQMESITVLGDNMSKQATTMQFVECHMCVGGIRTGQIVLPNILALLQQCPDALAAPIIGYQSCRADSGARVANQMLRLRYNVCQLLHLSLDDMGFILLLNDTLLVDFNALLTFLCRFHNIRMLFKKLTILGGANCVAFT